MSYGKFAQIYEQLMTDIPYDQYVNWIERYAPPSQFPALLDVGCGTGTLSLKLYSKGYHVSGLDISEEMLAVANETFQKNNVNIPLYCMSMDEVEGFSDLDCIIIPIDSINYLQDEESVFETFVRMYQSLRDGGQLFFDVHSVYKMDEIFLQSPFTYDDENITYIWYTEKGEEKHSVYHDLTFFVKKLDSDLYERFEETHFQKTYPIEQYVEWLKEAGFSNIEITADWTNQQPKEDSERIFFRAIK